MNSELQQLTNSRACHQFRSLGKESVPLHHSLLCTWMNVVHFSSSPCKTARKRTLREMPPCSDHAFLFLKHTSLTSQGRQQVLCRCHRTITVSLRIMSLIMQAFT